MSKNKKSPSEFQGQLYERPEEIGAWKSFGQFLWNSEEHTVMGRTGLSWAKIGIFYVIYYSVLAAGFYGMLMAFFQTLDPKVPKWQLSESRIGNNPGLGYRPMPEAPNLDTTLIWYRGAEKNKYLPWTEQLDNFLEVYRTPGLTPGRGENLHQCDSEHPPAAYFDSLYRNRNRQPNNLIYYTILTRGHTKTNEHGIKICPPARGQVCDVDVKNWAPCTAENLYGYHKSAPCIFLKLNKIYGWVPEFYNDSANLPEDMPLSLKEHIRETAVTELNTVWVSCAGENPADVENVGPIEYVPTWGFPGYFYPYMNVQGYLSPLVAVQLARPKPGVLINIECRAWAKNIVHDRQLRFGSVHFEVMID